MRVRFFNAAAEMAGETALGADATRIEGLAAFALPAAPAADLPFCRRPSCAFGLRLRRPASAALAGAPPPTATPGSGFPAP